MWVQGKGFSGNPVAREERERKGGPGIRLPGLRLPACWSVSAQYLRDLGPVSQPRTTGFLTCIHLVLRMNEVAALQRLDDAWCVVSTW